jgi:hypothetical protein
MTLNCFRKQYRRLKSLRHWWKRKPIFLINDTEEEEQDSDADEEGATVGLGDRVLTFWEKRRHKLETDFALYGWFLGRDTVIEKLRGLEVV